MGRIWFVSKPILFLVGLGEMSLKTFNMRNYLIRVEVVRNGNEQNYECA
jgi:hypothetical protein